MNVLVGRAIFYHQCWIICLLQLLSSAYGVPHPYCLRPLNRSNCFEKPTRVFSYYKPGSRCEIEVWRGCPTWNKFQDEYSCSKLCIFRMRDDDIETEELGALKAQEVTCEGNFDENDCGEPETGVFTYDAESATCIEKPWRGCASSNKFDEEAACIEKCVPVDEEVSCDGNFDEDDCGEPETGVFTYDAESATCIEKTWRGCPSTNKFDDEAACTEQCVQEEEEEEEEVSCEGNFDEDDCGAPETLVFTYDAESATCIEKTWRGCASSNKFDDEAACTEQCWQEKVDELDETEMEDVNEIIDDTFPESPEASEDETWLKPMDSEE